MIALSKGVHMSIAALIDHTLLAPDVTAQHIRTLCREAVDHGFATVCVSPTRVRLAADELAGHAPRVCSVIGFPSGAHLSEIRPLKPRLPSMMALMRSTWSST
ncbi:deoxyribose-phosphate aldolase [Cutibacterium acnes JCM 18918]|nr:deoxyribose-phosphate aldolase [Cutibacterium acnes JCM 18918]